MESTPFANLILISRVHCTLCLLDLQIDKPIIAARSRRVLKRVESEGEVEPDTTNSDRFTQLLLLFPGRFLMCSLSFLFLFQFFSKQERAEFGNAFAFTYLELLNAGSSSIPLVPPHLNSLRPHYQGFFPIITADGRGKC